jgi:stage II sporulation protein D
MDAERWRIALGAHVVRSTAFDVRVRGGELSLDDGRGFGHGMGLCQWGAEGLARRGWRAGRILRLYYPGIHFVRAY